MMGRGNPAGSKQTMNVPRDSLGQFGGEQLRRLGQGRFDEFQHTESAGLFSRTRRLQTLGAITAGIAHDFRNLLIAIGGQVEAARKGLPEDHAIQERLKMIESATRQASDLTMSLLGFAHDGRIVREPVNLTRLVTESVDLVRGMAPKSVRIATDIATSPEAWVDGDATGLRRVLINLTDNACEAMPHGGRLTISLRRRSAHAQSASAAGADGQETVELVVGDTGVGMSEKVRARLFRPFFSTKTGPYRTGLGPVAGSSHGHGAPRSDRRGVIAGQGYAVHNHASL